MEVAKLVVHHSASPRDTTTAAKIDSWHRSRGFNGIGYHKVILSNGTVVAGRSESTMGAHAKGANSKSLGVCLTGNFEKESPTTSQISSLVTLLESWCRQHRLKASMIYGHYNVPGGTTATACPGKNLISQLGAIREQVAQRLPKYAIEMQIVDPDIQRALRKALENDSTISYNDVISLISVIIKDGRAYPNELRDMRVILENSKSLDLPTRNLIKNFLHDPHGFISFGVSHCLVFNGRQLTWFAPGGVRYKSWSAVSGRPRYQSPEFQKSKNQGPIPEGEWVVRQSEYQRIPTRSLFEKLLAELGRTAWPGGESAWGRDRIWLHPQPGTNTWGRSGFSIHGGDSPGSAGCIDLTSAMPDFTKSFLAHREDMELTVKY